MRLVTCAMALAACCPGSAAAQDPLCLSADPPAIDAPPEPLRFGVFPQAAGSAGAEQGAVAPEDPVKTSAALHALEPPGRRLVVRLNRMFQSDGQAGIDRFAALADRYRREGFDVELQVRYHPSAAEEGDMAQWEDYVRRAVRTLARNPALVELSLTNEVNLPISENTSDGAFAGALDAIVRGVVAARETLDELGRQDVALGFTYAYRFLPNADISFWRNIGARATPAFRRALDHVGVQAYPGLFWPLVLLPGQTAGSALVEALTLVRHCYMPLAGLGDEVDLWVTENGYATNLGHTAERQRGELRSSVEEVHRYSGALGVTDYRYFNLRDNDSDGLDLFAAVGLLDDAYRAKPGFAEYRDLVTRFGETPSPLTCTRRIRLRRLRRGERYRRVRATVDGEPAKASLRRVRRKRFARVVIPARGRHRVTVRARTTRGRLVVVTRSRKCGGGPKAAP